jgi:lipopolysaccharide assembly protein A
VRVFTWAVRLAVFVLLVAFAAKNVEPVTLRFYFDLVVQAPLILVLFGFFAVGALFGIVALVPTLLRQRREVSLLKRPPTAPPVGYPPPPPL